MTEPTAPEPPQDEQGSAAPDAEPEAAPDAEPPASQAAAPAAPGHTHTTAFRIVAAIVIALAAGLIVWLVVRDDGSSTSTTATNATAVSEQELEVLAQSVGHPVYWLGPLEGTTYELARTSNGSIYVRYLPGGVEPGAKDPYLTVATYPYPGAYAAIQAVTKEPDTTTIPLADNGLAETSASAPTSVHAAYPGIDYQIEVFDPTPGQAEALVGDGKLAAFGSPGAKPAPAAEPEAATPAELESLAASLGHPIYWAGPKKDYTYELVQTTDGQVLIRYLPPGVEVGAAGQYLTIGTYPFPGALTALETLAKEPDVVAVKVKDGGLAVIDKKERKNIHLAYPGSDYQVEVFHPSAATARRVVTSGQVKSIG